MTNITSEKAPCCCRCCSGIEISKSLIAKFEQVSGTPCPEVDGSTFALQGDETEFDQGPWEGDISFGANDCECNSVLDCGESGQFVMEEGTGWFAQEGRPTNSNTWLPTVTNCCPFRVEFENITPHMLECCDLEQGSMPVFKIIITEAP